MKIRSGLFALLLATSANASDHLDSEYIDHHPEWDIGDLFLWTGAQTGSPVLLMTFNPLTNHPSATAGLKLDPGAVYQFKIDTDGDIEADIAYKFQVIGDAAEQGLVVMKATGAAARTNTMEEAKDSQTVAVGKTSVAGGPVKVIHGRNGELVFVGPRQDPFFFDFRSVESPAALDLRFALSADNLPSDGSAANTFGPTNMTVVAIEVPELKGKKFSAWSTTSVHGEQVDRCGRASITAIFTPNAPPGRNPDNYPYRNPYPQPDCECANDEPPPQDTPKQVYNTRRPVNDIENYREMFLYRLKQIQAPEDKLEQLLGMFLPDVLEYDPSQQPMAYPNGRNLYEDAVFITLNEINPFLEYDNVTYEFPARNPQKLSDNFPYAAAPVFFPEPYKQPVETMESQ
ncbi:MAG: DUF4331 family protein [Xanthomonadales bacterium]|nr:DUF4331 family protein [Xanthomonadales bacterium]